MRLIATLASVLCLCELGSVMAQGRQGQGQPQGVRDVMVTAVPGVVAAGAQWKLAWAGTDNADGLVGAADGGLLFAQEQPSRISKLDRNDQVSVFVENTKGTGAVALDSRGRLIAVQRTCTDPGLQLPSPCAEPTAVSIIYPEKERRTIADAFEGKPMGRLNDLVVNKAGIVFFTVGGAFMVRPDGKVSSVGRDLRTNGVMLSPDEKTLYITNGASVAAFDVQADGTPVNQREFAKLEAGGSGDGLAIDAAGRLYVTSQPGVQVFATDGKYLGVIPTPRTVISAAFAGPDKRTLYVVGSGALDANGREVTTAPGVRNNAKSIFKLEMLAQGFRGRAK